MVFDLEELAAIIEQLDKTEFTDFQFTHGELSLRVRRGGVAEVLSETPNAPVVTPARATDAPGAQTAPAPRAPAAPAAPGMRLDAASLPDGHVAVTASMLGTFYSAPKPGEPPFVAVGDRVSADSVLCIIEVMKLMNSVTSGVEGEVVEVFVHDGELVEFGQPLFAIRIAA